MAVEVREHGGRDRLKVTAPLRQPDAKRPPVVRVALTSDEARILHEPDEGGHRLLGHTGANSEGTHAQAVLLEEREQH